MRNEWESEGIKISVTRPQRLKKLKGLEARKGHAKWLNINLDTFTFRIQRLFLEE